MSDVVFLLEEPSAREMLKGILPRIIPDSVTPRYMVFEGKQDLEKNIVKRLRGWNLKNTIFVVIRDQDQADCSIVKKNLKNLCDQTGKTNVLIRIACRELESFYLGDLSAVEKGLGVKKLSKLQEKRKYRNPDKLTKPSEELRKLTKGRYQKVMGSRLIAPHLSLEGNRSRSFSVLISGLRQTLDS